MHDSLYDWGKDWRGTPLEPGCIVVYHVQTRGGKTVEAEVVSITDGDNYRGKTIMVRPLKESGIGVARPPTYYTREDKKLFAVPQLNVTVITTAPKKKDFSGFGGEVNKEVVKAVVKARKDAPRCRCGDFAGPNGTCNWGDSGCYNCPA